ncbi:MAG: DNA repair protein RecO [Candidatus Omnitrophica bacterium]|nr:DNA repair protein RecO [Candidatus Omnitrophota bacterium]MBU1128171.1 DNA repair protein RecO [Candidatus Omnitrophota bacterium]MBU1785205.1 DNA repair protein RecO [Candidatus Omnitrophota bacterium]MBU1852076.1 DNA repair protein RecO [Candidatus Omnitrophota bacterium]
MAALKAEGIVLRKYFLRETSYILVVFTREFGKIRGVLKGARNPYPQFAGNFELFTCCDLLFYKKKNRGMDLITRCEAVDFFFNVRKDIERLAYACYFIELVDTVAIDGQKSEELYSVLLDGLRLLGTDASPKRVSRIFELKLLDAVGINPMLDNCVECSVLAEDDIFFNVRAGGVLCHGCSQKHKGSFEVSKGTMNFMRKIRGCSFSRTQQIKVSKDVGRDTEKILKNFIQYHIGHQIKSVAFIDELEKKGILKKQAGTCLA